MKRAQERLSRAAADVAADLQRTTGQPWTCTVDAEYVLTVSNGAAAESVLLEADVKDPEWFVPPNATAAERDKGLAADAAETVASEVLEVMRVFSLDLPSCPRHGHLLSSCSGVWTCEGPTAHDVLIGELGK